ncbi:MAG: bifunctional (p)ppGpp synthetase/guanosine-3',5'-bis(diphosphate) 3'-pyrophosphohydrolase [Granulosicoccus sp.]
MKHAFRTDEASFSSPEKAASWLSAECTRTQALIIRRAVDLHWAGRSEKTHYPDPLYVAAQLKDMRADVPTIVSALLGNDVSAQLHTIEQIHDQFGEEYAKLVAGVRWLNELTISGEESILQAEHRDQAESLRRMVLSIVDDIRAVLVKLAYRAQRLYRYARSDSSLREPVARETLAIYAPLANRLGLGQLKWELEDVAFRIVEPAAYKRIASALEENRTARESYIDSFVIDLRARITTQTIIGASVFGRPKHIYSIWKKMRAKQLEFSGLFDVRAVRVLVDDLQQCYSVLGIVHSTWQPITREFDDYIANPKENGYRSLHTAVIGPGGKPVEVQIRTRDMDEHAENGVAAHWAYKEGESVDRSLQKNINALRQLLDDNDDEQLLEGFSQHIDSERVYVFTPKGEVIDLVAGATPLDFAYHIHSEVGHRCRGAKVNGSIVTLTYHLQHGDQVEVLTTREPAPSRDWLNKSLGYLNSGRARGKVRAWFNTQDHEQHLLDGRAILDREIKRLKAHAVSIDKVVQRLKFDKPADLFAAIGRNEISMPQIVGAIDHLSAPVVDAPVLVKKPRLQAARPGEISVRGVGNLLTQVASCCQPVPHDAIVGFITRGKGVSIHRADCNNILNLRDEEQERLIEVDWGTEGGIDTRSRYRVDICVRAFDRTGLLRDVSTTLATLDADVVAVNTVSDAAEQTADMKIGLMVVNMKELAVIMDRVRQLRNVQTVDRVI